MSKPWLCTMKPNTEIVKAPKKNGSSGYKWPSLEEALQFYCKRSVGEFAHDAMYDVKACRDIFFAQAKRPEFETVCFIDYETTGFVIGGPVVTEGQGRAWLALCCLSAAIS